MLKTYDVAVIGAGPAGIAASVKAREFGASVLVLDEAAQPGGQIYRAVSQAVSPSARVSQQLPSGAATPNRLNSVAPILGQDYLAGKQLVDDFLGHSVRLNASAQQGNAQGASDGGAHSSSKTNVGVLHYLANTTVWHVDRERHEIIVSIQSEATDPEVRRIAVKQLIIATGAIERAMPLPGWTLPGVLSIGAAQILLKAHAMAPDRAVLVGCGPLLYLTAIQLVNAGRPPLAIVETPLGWKTALRYLPAASRKLPALLKGLRWIYQLRRQKIPFYRGCGDIQIDDADTHRTVSFSHNGNTKQITTDVVLLHQGVVPNTQMTRSIGLHHKWNSLQRCFLPDTNDVSGHADQAELVDSDLLGVSVAGDGAAIGGAECAVWSGKLAALDVLGNLQHINQRQYSDECRPLLARISKENALRRFLDALYAPANDYLLPTDQTVVCRCEGVTAGEIRKYAGIGCVGPNQTKAFGRCGMGPCQGRTCGLVVTELLADANNQSHQLTGYFRIRTPIKPVTLAELASLSDVDDVQATDL